MDLGGIGEHGGRIGRDPRLEFHPGRQAGPEENEGCVDDEVQALGEAFARVAAAESQSLADEFAGAVRGGGDAVEPRVDGMAGRELEAGEVDGAEGAVEDVVEIVGDAAGERAERLHRAALAELGLDLFPLFLGALEVGNVGEGADVTGEFAVGVTMGAGLADEPADGAVGAHKAKFRGGGFAGADGLRPGGGDRRTVGGMQGGLPAVAEGLFDGEAGEFAPAAVDEGGAAGRVGAEDADGGNFGEDAEAFLALAERGLGGEAVGDVAETPDAAGGAVGHELRV